MYLYTLCLTVQNPVNASDASNTSIEELRLDFTYTDENGYGSEKKYTLDLTEKTVTILNT